MKGFADFVRPYKFLGVCDQLRRQSQENELYWNQMYEKSSPATREEFLSQCDLTKLLDEDETPDQWIDYHTDAEFAKSVWGNRPAYYIMTSGFEFIFVKQ